MSRLFEELDYRMSSLGPLSLRRRRFGDEDVYEIILGEEYLMSSRFTAAEVALARIGLARCALGALDVVVGGLGLGYTAAAVLENERVRSLHVVDSLAEVIEWHRTGLLPLGPALSNDPRCTMVLGDFFGLSGSADGFDRKQPGRRFHAILVDIDHSPSNLLDPGSSAFYSRAGLQRLRAHLHEAGVFALWSNDAPDATFIDRLQQVFRDVQADVVEFKNLGGSETVSNTVYSALA